MFVAYFFCIKSSFDPYDCVTKVFKHLSPSAKTGFKLQAIFYFVSQEPVETLRHVTTGSFSVFQPFEDEDYSIVIFKPFEVGEGTDVRKSLNDHEQLLPQRAKKFTLEPCNEVRAVLLKHQDLLQ